MYTSCSPVCPRLKGVTLCRSGEKVLKVSAAGTAATLLEASDETSLTKKSSGLQPVTAGVVFATSLPKQTKLITFLCPAPGISAASWCPFILIFSLSAICLLNNSPPYFPTIPYPLCLRLYSHGLTMALPKHNCLLLVSCLHFLRLTSSRPSPSLATAIQAIIALGLVTGRAERPSGSIGPRWEWIRFSQLYEHLNSRAPFAPEDKNL